MTLHFAVLGPGTISHRFLKGLKECPNASALAFASRHPENVQDYARQEQIQKVYTLEEMCKDPDIDAVYVSTPPFVHYQEIKACLNAGKHVLCEKPLCETPAQAKELYALAEEKKKVLMEAQKALFVPAYGRIRNMLKDQVLGEVQYAEASFCRCYDLPKTHWVYSQPCNGAMYDVGVYPLSVLLSLFPQGIQSLSRTDIFEGSCPVTSSIIMKTENQVLLHVNASMNYEGDNTLYIYGKKGRIVCRDFWKTHEVETQIQGVTETYRDEYPSEFAFEIRHFLSLIENHRTASDISTPALNTEVLEIVSNQWHSSVL